jgi:hypothetical protein
VLTVITIFTIVMISKNKKNKRDARSDAIIKQYENQVSTSNLSFTESEYEDMAMAIDNAIGFWSDNEEVIKQQFMKLKTNSDLLKLQAVFGTRSAGHTLFEAIHRNLNNEEIQELNSILAQRNISIKI